jgi:vacuolar-type H+-ATPase subunit I/STV1
MTANSYQSADRSLSSPSKLASMIAFHYRNRYLGHRRGRRVTFTDFSAEDEYFYKKRDVIHEIETRNDSNVWYDGLLLKSELWNLDNAIENATNHYYEMSKIIWVSPHMEEDEKEDYIEELRQEIEDLEERKKREVAKREGKFEEYKERLESEWESECWQNYLNQRSY